MVSFVDDVKAKATTFRTIVFFLDHGKICPDQIAFGGLQSRDTAAERFAVAPWRKAVLEGIKNGSIPPGGPPGD
jgi:hypothetical protein